ncbi:MAG: T9SS type A sorting domain-containing protein [Bacteroidetes bacterium]|nr:T9SS type A sorting domain-containing protein [Bacteroidota bacterium]
MKKQLLRKLSAFIFTAMLFSASANAQIVYTDVTPDQVISATTIPSTEDYNIDLNNDGINDYKISCSRSGGICPLAPSSRLYINFISDSALNSNAVVTGTSITYPLAMNLNDSISSGLSFSSFGYLRRNTSGGPCTGTFGVWSYSIDRYLGLKLIVGGNTYYGWARMQIDVVTGIPSCTIKDYAYNSIPNQPILAGDTGTVPTGIFENSFSSSINLFPNPANNHLTIALGSNNKKVEVAIADMTGKIIYTTIAYETNRIEVNTSEFAEGIYIVQIGTEKYIETKKFIVKK